MPEEGWGSDYVKHLRGYDRGEGDLRIAGTGEGRAVCRGLVAELAAGEYRPYQHHFTSYCVGTYAAVEDAFAVDSEKSDCPSGAFSHEVLGQHNPLRGSCRAGGLYCNRVAVVKPFLSEILVGHIGQRSFIPVKIGELAMVKADVRTVAQFFAMKRQGSGEIIGEDSACAEPLGHCHAETRCPLSEGVQPHV